ncbi:MAG TPA: DUF4160 domain-containing protein [Isosphaeraceae bacterium]|nr:DUF4160 domain-containing protein [Isosphaeraceae bacterium]
MPRVSQFYGIAIYMYYNDHAPPHFHAEYAEDEALFTIDTLQIFARRCPSARSGLGRRMGNVAPR